MTINDNLKTEALIFDIETYSDYDIIGEFDKYIKDAQPKWIGFYSYKTKKYYELQVSGNEKLIRDFISKHNPIVGFNNKEFDEPILVTHNIWPEGYKITLDLLSILGNKIGHKNRGKEMGYQFRKNSLLGMAKTMNLPTQKGEIDYQIFKKDSWNINEEKEIRKYLRADIEVTKLMFDKVFDFWLPFTSFVSKKNVQNWTWLSSSIGSLVYKILCNVLKVEETYGEKGAKTEGGGRVIEPKVEEARDIWYVDVTSQYPHMYALFNLFNEVPAGTKDAWHGNTVFKVQGYYDISKEHKIGQFIKWILKERARLKKEEPENPLIYAYKIIANTIYGTNRSEVFEKVHTENSGADCCYLGRQVNIIMEKKGDDYGYDTIAADTDSNFWKYRNGERTYGEVKTDLQKIVKFIQSNVPFPQETFDIDIEAYIHYIMFIKDGDKMNKKKYAYVYEGKNGKEVKIMGLDIIKTNATELGPLIFEKYVKSRMIKEVKGKFERSWIENLIRQELENNVELMAQEYKVKAFRSYSFAGKNGLHAQISKHYLGEQSGTIKLIKNNRIGKAGTLAKYCTIDEAKTGKLKSWEINMDKLFNELSPFVVGGLNSKKKSKFQGTGFFNDNNSSGSQTTLKIKKSGFFK